MMKGIAQSKRNSAWHTRHTKKLAVKRRNLSYRLATRGRVEQSFAERQFKAAIEREKKMTFGFKDRMKFLAKRLFSRRNYA